MSIWFQPSVGWRRLKIAAAAVFVLLLADSTNAATTTSTIAVHVTVTSSCVIRSAATLNFGNHGVLVANVDGTSTLRVQCTNGTPYNIGLNAGNGSGATVFVRKMTHGASTINYSLYSDSGRTIVWGNTVGSNTVAGTGNGAPQSYTVYGRVPPQTTPAAATYTDTITVTVTY
jgi:spore coat protein U-like protein